jgi:hypothetical protein
MLERYDIGRDAHGDFEQFCSDHPFLRHFVSPKLGGLLQRDESGLLMIRNNGPTLLTLAESRWTLTPAGRIHRLS